MKKGKKASFESLLAEGKNISARKKIEAKTAYNIQYMKQMWDKRQERVLEGTLVRNHIRAEIEKNTCPKCKEHSEQVAVLSVWSRGQNQDHEIRWRCTARITAQGMWDFHNDLPIRIIEVSSFNICASCVRAKASKIDEKATV